MRAYIDIFQAIAIGIAFGKDAPENEMELTINGCRLKSLVVFRFRGMLWG
jgi:hypothetical protein